MKKKLVLFFVLIVSSVLSMVGCGSNPYEKMSIVSSVKEEMVQLNISEQKVNGNSTYTYEPYSFDVQVKEWQ